MTIQNQFLLALCLLTSPALATLSPKDLRCEYLTNPLGIDSPRPRLSWTLESKARAQDQSAYQVVVASSEAKLNSNTSDLWDSGKVASGETLHISYEGKPLASSERCCWKVRVWDREGNVSACSKPAFWEMGLLAPEDWQGQWIGRTTDTNSNPAPLLRPVVTLD